MAGAGESRRVEVDAARLAGWLDRFARRHGEVAVALTAHGADLAAGDGASASVAVPWPAAWAPGDRAPGDRIPGDRAPADDPLAALVEHALRPRVVGMLLVRRGGFAVGVVEGAELVASKLGRRHVQGRTKAGGWSQQRYARRRDAQAERAFTAAADAVVQTLLPRSQQLEGLVPGGDRRAVDAVLSDRRLRPLHGLPQGRFLAVPDPRRQVLDDAVRRSRAVLIEVVDPTTAER